MTSCFENPDQNKCQKSFGAFNYRTLDNTFVSKTKRNATNEVTNQKPKNSIIKNKGKIVLLTKPGIANKPKYDILTLKPVSQASSNASAKYENISLLSRGKHTAPNISKFVSSIIKGTNTAYDTTKPVYVHKVPNALSQVASAIENPESFVRENPEWKMLSKSEELGHNVLVNEANKEVWVNFHGFDGRPEWSNNALNNIPRNNVNAIEQSSDIINNYDALIDGIESAEENGFKVKFNGHSYGGYKAKYFGSLFNKDQELLNAHIFPWNTFESNNAISNFHTTISDPLNFKHIFPLNKPNENHFYYPGNVNPETEGIMGKVIDGHYISSFDKSEKQLTNFSEYMNNVGILGTLGVGMTAYQASGDFKQKKDPTNDISGNLMGLTDIGAIGVNVDPEYEWNDDKPPESALDYLLYKTTQPLKQSILNNTSWGQRRKRQDKKYDPDWGERLSKSQGRKNNPKNTKYVEYDGASKTPKPANNSQRQLQANIPRTQEIEQIPNMV